MALVKVCLDVLTMGVATAGLVHGSAPLRAMYVVVLAATFFWLRRDWPELCAYLVKQGDCRR